MPSGHSPSGMPDYGGSRREEDKAPKYFIELAVLLDRAMVSKISYLISTKKRIKNSRKASYSP